VPQTLPDPNSTPRAVVTTTAVENVRAVPLRQLANTAERMLQRIIPPADASKASFVGVLGNWQLHRGDAVGQRCRGAGFEAP